MSQEDINPTDVYKDKELQDNYTQLTLDDEPIAIIIPFQKEVEKTDLIDSNPEDNNENVVNFSEIIESEAGLYDNMSLEIDKDSEEENNKKLVELKKEIIEQDKNNTNLKEPKKVNPILEAGLSNIYIWTKGK